jgi:transcriptional regulator with XRE-family HTH domain
MIELYKIIRKFRTSANLTQADIAEVCGVTRNAVTQWESLNEKTRTEPSLADLEKIARMCHVSLADMLASYDIKEEGSQYLVGTDTRALEEEQLMLTNFRSLNAENKSFLLLTLKILSEKQSNS